MNDTSNLEKTAQYELEKKAGIEPSRIIRWLLLLPCSALGAWLAWILVNLFTFFSLARESGFSRLFFNTAGHTIMGFVFVFIGVMLAPSHRKKTAYVLAALAFIFSGMVFEKGGRAMWDGICMFAGVLIGILILRKKSLLNDASTQE